MNQRITAIGAILAGLAVVLGAFGAHALETMVSPERIEIFNTGVKYQFYHAFAILFVGGFWDSLQAPKPVFRLWIAGIIGFSGSLYLLTFREVFNTLPLSVLGPSTPIGGSLLIIGWIILVIRLLKAS